MKRLIAILTILACVLSAPIAAFAANETSAPAPEDSGTYRLSDGKYSNIGDLYQYWEANGYPDYVGGVYSTSGDMTHLTVLLVDDDGTRADQIRASLVNDSGVSFGKAEFSHNTLTAVNDEIVANDMKEGGKVYGVGVGWTSVNGEVTGFGESGKESRVVVTVDESVLAEYAEKFHELYGDMVVVEAGEPMWNSLISKEIPADSTWLLPLMIFVIMAAGASILLFRRARLVPVMQTTKGTVAPQGAPVSRRETINAVKSSELDPSDKVFRSILQKIDKTE